MDLRWAAVTLEGVRSTVTPQQVRPPVRHSAFVAELDLRAVEGDGTGDVALGLVLPCWTLLGMLDRGMELTREHVLGREQFGQPLAGFQSVQFQLTEAEVERNGVEMLARYALWSIQSGRPDAIEDALALRLAAVEAAETVLRVTHQLHGATGVSQWTPLARLYAGQRTLRLADGPDEVHHMVVGRAELRRYETERN